MNLMLCLESLQGYSVDMINNGGRLVIQSPHYTITDTQKATLTTHKPLLLSILPNGKACPVGAVLDALEAYQEREAITLESGTDPFTAKWLALEQAQRLL